ncbi:Kelch motif protein [Alienimonas californiensis]|uniref:Kelch motif protein n=1 Tax=Alienimonas californiensis TaxID=2527989 RepID=A0A517P720_9PLAN|nr:Kelch motif protein [Alienimonas californiensis]
MFRTASLAVALALLAPAAALAHFPFLTVQDDGDAPTLRLTFGEGPEEDDPEYLPILQKATVVRHTPDGARETLELTADGGALTADVAADPAGTVYTLSLPYGAMSHEGAAFFLDYAATAMKAGPAGAGRPAALNTQPLAVVAEPGNKLKVIAAGLPVPGAEVNASGDLGGEDYTADAHGVVTLTQEEIDDAGLLIVRANVTVPGAGVYDGTNYSETRRYATAVFSAKDFQAAPAKPPAPEQAAAAKLSVEAVPGADLPVGVTSLGAAVADGYLYYYGGHPGTPHKYSTDEQSGEFRRLKLDDTAAGWEDLPGGPKLQGLALVPHPKGGVVRIGGFTARNSIEEDDDLHSMPTVAHYDPEAGEWKDLPDLPGGRSSFDAAVLNGKVYVLGGWMMAGDEGAAWHGSGYVADLNAEELKWETLPTPPAPRRANSVAAVPEAGGGGRIYHIGGMLPEGETTRRVDIYDVATKTWLPGPELNGDSMDGFGSAAYAVNGAVYATTLTGLVQRLTPGADAWENLGELENPRFFHRLLPTPGENGAPSFLLLGGGSMEKGRFTTVERLGVSE